MIAHSSARAAKIRAAMRANKVTIRDLAKSMGLTISRVREVRAHGTPPAWANASEFDWTRDWFDGIQRAADTKDAS